MISKHVELDFSEKYVPEHASHYHDKHQRGLVRRISNWREQRIAARALNLAGSPVTILDLPCGTGRFWQTLAEDSRRQLLAADYNQAMIDVALQTQPDAVRERFRTMQTSAFDIDLPDGAVDCVFSMRLLHHIGSPDDRQKILREFHRVTRDSVVLSLWVSGNIQAWRRQRRDAVRKKTSAKNRFMFAPHAIEAEFQRAGFRVTGSVDLLKCLSMWRIYVLRKEEKETS